METLNAIRKYWHVLASVALVLGSGIKNDDTIRRTSEHVSQMETRLSAIERNDAAKQAQLNDIQSAVHDIQNHLYK